jgi:hypothetical protein
MKTLRVSITKHQVKVISDNDNLLVTNNNINAYTKLYKVLQDEEADKYILSHWGKDIAETDNKNEFMSVLSKWFEN